MLGVPFRFGPLALTNTYTTDILNPGTTTGGVNSTGAPYAVLFIILSTIRVVNKTTSDATFRLYLGATATNAAGTELFYDETVPAKTSRVFTLPKMRLGTSDFLVGGASASTTLTIEGEGIIGVGA